MLKNVLTFTLLFSVLVNSAFAEKRSFLETTKAIEETSLKYFIEQAHPVTGLVRDKAENFKDTPANNRVASMAATGFGMAIIANAATRGLVSKDYALDYLTKVARFSRDRVPRYKGWFLHWVDWETGQRAWNSEYSPIDTALFMAGALYASAIFPNTELASITRQLYIDMDYKFFLTDDGKKPRKLTMSLSYTHEKGFVPYQWSIYAEQLILLVLGMGHPTKPISMDVWSAWRRQALSIPGLGYTVGYNMPIFIHQYSHLFLDFRNLRDVVGEVNYFENSIKATKLHRQISRISFRSNKTFDEGFWGLSAGEDPKGYVVYDPTNYGSTVCMGCTVASAMFMPEVVLKDVQEWINGPYRERIWGRYGLSDSIDLESDWVSHMALGITVGPEYLSLANINNETSVWKAFMQIPEIKKAMSTIMKK